jgi:hypothetical protein
MRNQALEEAAVLCDVAVAKWLEETPPRSYEAAWSAALLEDMAARIRGAKTGGEP